MASPYWYVCNFMANRTKRDLFYLCNSILFRLSELCLYFGLNLGIKSKPRIPKKSAPRANNELPKKRAQASMDVPEPPPGPPPKRFKSNQTKPSSIPSQRLFEKGRTVQYVTISVFFFIFFDRGKTLRLRRHRKK